MKKTKPTSPSRRNMSFVDYSVLTASEPHKALTRRIKSHAGRNNRGVITMRHQGGGNKKLYREIDFKQQRIAIPARVESIEYDPYRSAFIALLCYRDGLRAYILAHKDMKKGDTVVTVEQGGDLAPGNRMRLRHIPVGTSVHNIEIRPGAGGKLARSAGSSAEVLAQEDGFTNIKLSSKEIRKIPWLSFATIGQVSNSDYNLVTIGKAGRNRWKGKRPTVRGTAMNPVDHPYGGGEGSQPRGTKRPKTKWGKVTGGRKTRNRKKWSNAHIISRRPAKRKK